MLSQARKYLLFSIMSESSLVLDKKQTLQKIKRMACEIYEVHFNEKEVVLAGIWEQGYAFAKLLEEELTAISPLKVTLVKVTLDKLAASQPEVSLDVDLKTLKNKCIVLTDDVLNTGKTVAYSLQPFLGIKVKSIHTAVVVNREHAAFPIRADFVGLYMSTSLKEHIEVKLKGKEAGVWLR
jgi:pyrimidine operon attenuation protein/uracil phosphoribosyltransferase